MFQLFSNEMHFQQFSVSKPFTQYNIYGLQNALQILKSITEFQKFSLSFTPKIKLNKSFIL